MSLASTTDFYVGDWRVNPAVGEMSREGQTVRLETRTMRLLVCLAEHAGEVVSIDELLDKAWAGVNVSQDSVYQAVASLRRLLGDDPKEPTYIANLPRLGYRMVAKVSPCKATVDEPPLSAKTQNKNWTDIRRMKGLIWLGAGLGAVLIVAVVVLHDHRATIDQSARAAATQPEKSIAVLPFLDLTEDMKEEPFADGMTEELIDKLSKIPGMRVPPPTSSFYFKGKQISIADMAKALGVAYILDGSIRKSGKRVRVAARLVRASNGYIAWSETYDRPFGDLLMVQDDIAGEVTKALGPSLTP